MAHYKCIASRPADRELLLSVLLSERGDTDPLYRKIHAVHDNAHARAQHLAADHSPLIAFLANLALTTPDWAPSVSVAIDALTRERQADATYRRKQGIVTLNLTRQDCDVVRQCLRAYATRRPATLSACQAMYKRLAPAHPVK